MLATLALAASLVTPSCGTPAALRGDGPHQAGPPGGIGVLDGEALASRGGKAWYGTPYDTRVDTENFTINWVEAGDADATVAQAAGEALEAGWAGFVEDHDWPMPVSADTFLLWVVLDPDLGSTGLTTEYVTDEYPQGYPVIYLDPQWIEYPSFFAALAQHELMHAIQYQMRDNWTPDAGEAWYWEASAQWAPALAAPAGVGHATAAEWYSARPWLRFDSMQESHQYGMMVLNAWLDEALGAGTMRAVWEASATAGTVGWDVILEEATGLGVDALWGGFSGAMGNDLLAESAIYADVLVDGPVVDGTSGSVAYLGTDYFEVTEDGVLEVIAVDPAEPLVLGGPRQWGAVIDVDAGDIIGVVGLAQGVADYVLQFDPPVGGDDDDDDDDAAGDDDDAAGDDDDAAGDDDDDGRPAACACTSAGAAPSGLGLGLIVALGRLRRRR